jgi:chemotaxis signal transduction protein
VVDQVKDVVRVDTRTIRAPTADIPGVPAESASGFIERDERAITILNAARLLTGAEQAALSEART